MSSPKNESGFYSILFHALYKKEDYSREKHPYMFISVDEFEACIETFLENGFTFIEPDGLLKGNVDGNNKQILLTFDDGYFNNYYALDILEKYSIKAIFFFVKHQVVNQKLFWWDVYFKNRINKVSFSTLYEEIQEFKKFERVQIEEKFKCQFSTHCFDARDDFDRPMTAAELKDFSCHPLVEIGVHSASHEILTNCNGEKIKYELSSCKGFLEDTTKQKISFVSYPNGNFNDKVISITNDLHFKFGFTTISGLNQYEDLKNLNNKLVLKRNVFPVPKDPRNVVKQVEDFKNQILSR